MAKLVLNGATSGSITLESPAVSGTNTLTLPASTGTVALTADPTFTGQATIPTINLTGGQIVFPSTQSASANANTLDDYEEGTWTPALARVGASTLTYTLQNGNYVKIGKQVTVTFRVHINAVTTQGSSVNYVTNLPFPAITAASSNIYFAGSVGQNTAFSTITVTNCMQAADGIGNITFHQATNNSSNVDANWVASGIVVGTTTYFTD
jgi:hypothetical protein